MAKAESESPRGVAKLSIHDLQSELMRRERSIAKLQRKFAKHMASAAAVEEQIRGLGGNITGRSGRGSRPRNAENLVQSMARLLKGKTMSVTDISQAVQDAGYRTTSPNFRTIVNQALIKNTIFKNVSRGQYTLKG